jgi:TolA-binding protein
LARAQFEQFIQAHPENSRASEAQYYLGAVAYAGENYESAVRNFDLVLERYPMGTVSADAQYKKGMALLRLSRPAEAAYEFRSLLDRFPNSNVAPNAKALLEQIQEGEAKPSPTRRSGRL